MKSPLVRGLRASLGLVACLGLTSLALAVDPVDQTVTGNLSVEGDTDLQGNTLSLGTRSDSSTTPGLNLLYGDATAPTIYFSATRGGANWLWQSNTNKSQLKLTTTNQLQLFDQAATPAVKITLNPNGTSSFAGPVIFGSAVNLNGGIGSIAGNLSASGDLHAGRLLTAEGGANIGGDTTISGNLNLLNVDGVVSVGSGNQADAANAGGGVFGSNNEVGGAETYVYGSDSVLGVAADSHAFKIAGDYQLKLENWGGWSMLFSVSIADYDLWVSDVYYDGVDTYIQIDIWSYYTNMGFAEISDGVGNSAELGFPGNEVVVIYGVDVTGWLVAGGSYAVTAHYDIGGYGAGVVGAYYDGVDTYVTLDSDYFPGSTSYVDFAFDYWLPVKASGASAFGSSNVVQSNNGLAFGSGNTVIVGDNGSLPLGGGAYGIGNSVYADNAYAFGQGINNYSQNSVQVGSSDNAKLTVDGAGNVSTTGSFKGVFNATKLTVISSGLLDGGNQSDRDQKVVFVGLNKAISSGLQSGQVGIFSNDGFLADAGGSLVFGSTFDAAGHMAINAGIKSGRDSATSGNYGGYLSLYTRANGGSAVERLRITSSGNVGIGTASPTSKLEVVGPIKQRSADGLAELLLDTNVTYSYTGDKRYVLSGNGALSFGLSNNGHATDAGALMLGIGSNKSVISGGGQGQSWLEFYTGNVVTTPKMVITPSGDVGIGIGVPSTKLEVAGEVKTSPVGTAKTGVQIGAEGGAASSHWVPRFRQ